MNDYLVMYACTQDRMLSHLDDFLFSPTVQLAVSLKYEVQHLENITDVV